MVGNNTTSIVFKESLKLNALSILHCLKKLKSVKYLIGEI